MRNTKLVAGLSVAALTALGVTAFTFGGNGNQEEKKEETANIQEVKQEAEYTGDTFVSSSLLSALYDNVENNAKLKEQTGTLMYSEAGMS